MPNQEVKMTSTPPEGCPWKVGDKVTFTNDQDVVFPGHKVMGFTLPGNECHGRTVYIDTDCYWFPKRPDSLTAE